MGVRYSNDIFCPICHGKQYVYLTRKIDNRQIAVTCRRCRENLIKKQKWGEEIVKFTMGIMK